MARKAPKRALDETRSLRKNQPSGSAYKGPSDDSAVKTGRLMRKRALYRRRRKRYVSHVKREAKIR